MPGLGQGRGVLPEETLMWILNFFLWLLMLAYPALQTPANEQNLWYWCASGDPVAGCGTGAPTTPMPPVPAGEKNN